MKISEVCSSPVFVAHPDQALAAAAQEMHARGIGALVVIAPRDLRRSPLGILTDRDIVCGQVSCCADLRCLTVAEVMTHHPLCIRAETELHDAIALLNSRGVRRAPVIDDAGSLTGIVSLDDLLPAIAQQLGELADIATPRSRPRAAPPQTLGAVR